MCKQVDDIDVVVVLVVVENGPNVVAKLLPVLMPPPWIEKAEAEEETRAKRAEACKNFMVAVGWWLFSLGLGRGAARSEKTWNGLYLCLRVGPSRKQVMRQVRSASPPGRF